MTPRANAFQHFVLTRFNVDLGGHRRSWDDAWLASRFELFRAWCHPSMREQSEQRFTWIVFFDASSRATVEPMLAGLPPMPNLHVEFTRGVFGPETARRAVEARYDGSSATLLSTRLDCDDALRADVVARLRAEASEATREVLNFPLGYQVADGRFYVTFDPMNAFCTLVEPWAPDSITTVYGAQHQDIGSLAPVRQVCWSPSWVQVIHGENLANKVQGVRTARRRAAAHFGNLPALAALPPREGGRELLRDVVRSAGTVGHKLVTHPAARRRTAALVRLPRRSHRRGDAARRR